MFILTIIAINLRNLSVLVSWWGGVDFPKKFLAYNYMIVTYCDYHHYSSFSIVFKTIDILISFILCYSIMFIFISVVFSLSISASAPFSAWLQQLCTFCQELPGLLFIAQLEGLLSLNGEKNGSPMGCCLVGFCSLSSMLARLLSGFCWVLLVFVGFLLDSACIMASC